MSATRSPKYRRQKRPSGDLAFVELGGKRIYLGAYGSAESYAKHVQITKEWEANGGRLTVPADDLTIVELCAAHRKYAEGYYPASSRSELEALATAAAAMTKLYDTEPVAKFGPLRFKAVRQELMNVPDKRAKHGEPRTRSRQYVNGLCKRIRRIIKWGVSEEMVPASVLEALKAVPALHRGRTEARETEPVRPVAESVIDSTCMHLTPTVAAMVRQQYTGMRPGEVCLLRTCDVNIDSDVWTYKPPHHKLSHRGIQRTVYLGLKAIAVLKPLLKKDLNAYIFSPEQSEKERRERVHAERKTPPGQGNEPGICRKRLPKKTPGGHYTTAGYAQAIRYACRQAFGEDRSMYWGPNRLRHSFATQVRREHGLEAAQVLLGHAAVDTTRVYAERDVAKARRVIAQIG